MRRGGKAEKGKGMKIRGDKKERKIAEIKGCLSQVKVHIRVWQDFQDLWDTLILP